RGRGWPRAATPGARRVWRPPTASSTAAPVSELCRLHSNQIRHQELRPECTLGRDRCAYRDSRRVISSVDRQVRLSYALDAKLGAGRQLSVVNQICGSPCTPARCMTFRRASDETKALATSAVSKSCHAVTSFGSSTN